MDTREEEHNHQVQWSLDCEVHAPVIIVPKNARDTNGQVLIFDFGFVRLASS